MEVIKSNVVFTVVDGKLIKMKRVSQIAAKNIHIPRVLSKDVEITTIGSCFCDGKYNKITIDNEIKKIESHAFRNSQVREVVWPDDCDAIPSFCFAKSDIAVLSNIEHVKYVGDYAFVETCNLEEFVWPSMCREIPGYCFLNSSIRSIRNIGSVEYIGAGAFCRSNIAEIVWPSVCQTIPNSCFSSSKLSRISNIQSVTSIEDFAFDSCMLNEFVVPYGVTEISRGVFAWCEKLKKLVLHDDISDIESSAFADTSISSFEWPKNCSVVPDYCFSDSKLESLSFHPGIEKIGREAFSNCNKLNCIDLSCLIFCEFDKFAFQDTENCKIIMPYYMNQEEINKIKG